MGYEPVNSSTAHTFAVALFVLLMVPARAFGARVGPGEATVRGLIASMKNLAGAKTPAEREATLARVNRSLALERLAEESLGAQWGKLSRAERNRFVTVFKRSIEKLAYPRASRALGDIKVSYNGEEVKSPGLVVKTSVTRPEGGKIPVDYMLARERGRWMVVDVNLDGESLAKAVRQRIQKALKEEGYNKLLADLEKRLAQAPSGAPAPQSPDAAAAASASASRVRPSVTDATRAR